MDKAAKKLILAVAISVLGILSTAGISESAGADANIEKMLAENGLPNVSTNPNAMPELQVVGGNISDDTTWKLIDEYFKGTTPETQMEVSERAVMEQNLAMNWLNVDRKEDLKLREIDKRALELVQEFQKAQHGTTPTLGGSGAVHLTFSSYTPKIMCRPMRVTDIMLQPGEKVTGVHAGDTVRWTYTPGISGSGENAITHVMVKPLAPDISTNLVIHTDRRVYNLDLVSSSKEFFPSVSFGYPDDDMRQWMQFMNDKKKEGKVLNEGGGVNPEDLDFGYEIRGSQSWKPLRAWNDGRQVYIQMPKGWEKSGMEAPVLIVYEKKKERIVNYRVKGDLIICDNLFEEKCALIAGHGSSQDRVVIIRKK